MPSVSNGCVHGLDLNARSSFELFLPLGKSGAGLGVGGALPTIQLAFETALVQFNYPSNIDMHRTPQSPEGESGVPLFSIPH